MCYGHVSLEPPVLKGEAHTSQTVAQSGTAMLDCPVHGDPSPVLRWVHDGRPLLRSLRLQPLHNGSLAIYSITVNTTLDLSHLSYQFPSEIYLSSVSLI